MPDPDGKLSMEELLTQAAGGTITETNDDDTVDPDPAETNEPEDVETNTDDQTTNDTEETPEEKSTKETKKANPVKEIRDRYTSEKTAREKIEQTIQRFTEGDYSFKLKDFMIDGKVDYDALSEAMEKQDIKSKAESRGVSPEVQAEIERIERDKIEIEKQKLQIAMDKALTNMQLDMGLKTADINNFFKDALAVKKNPYQWIAQGGELRDLYLILNRDRLIKDEVDKAVAEARIKWEEETRRQTKVPASNPARQTPQPDGNNNSGLSMEQLLAEAAKRRR